MGIMQNNMQNSLAVKQTQPETSMLDRYRASMLIAAVGDAIGYYRGHWEFCYEGEQIHSEMMKMTDNRGVLHLKVDAKHFPYSDDTVMHIATAKALVQSKPTSSSEHVQQRIAQQYKACWKYMPGRAPGGTCARYVAMLKPDGSNWKEIPYSDRAGGCGAAMRSAAIGLFYFNNYQKLIEISIEAGRMTHHNPIGFLGSMVSSYFTALAINNVNPAKWLSLLFKEAFPLSRKYILQANRNVKDNLDGGDWTKYIKTWKKYADDRKMSIEEESIPVFPQNYGVAERQKFYYSYALTGWPGATGLDSAILAYDALLGAKDNYEQMCLRSMLHGGDNDSTGTMAGAWYGALYGFHGVPIQNHVSKLEDRQLIDTLGSSLYAITHPNSQLKDKDNLQGKEVEKSNTFEKIDEKIDEKIELPMKDQQKESKVDKIDGKINEKIEVKSIGVQEIK